MKMMKKIAFGGYLFIAIVTAAIGIRYLFASQIMPYHLAAMDATWEALSPGAQVMTLNFMKSAGVGFLTSGLAIALLLFFPFRKGEGWSCWALLLVSLCQLALMTARILDVRLHTPATPPLIPFIVLIAIAAGSFLLAFAGMRTRQESGQLKQQFTDCLP